jgi:multiple sugar transport system permease protein
MTTLVNSNTTQALPVVKKARKRNWGDALTGYLFIAPNMLVFLVWVLLPILFSVYLSFTQWDFIAGVEGIEFVGLKNYERLPGDEWFAASLRNTVQYTMAVVPLQLVSGLFFAMVMNGKVYFSPLIRGLLFVPYITSPVAVAAVWLSLFHPRGGPVNQVLYMLGITNLPGWFASSDWAMLGIIIVGVWAGLGYNALIFLAGLQSVPEDLYEASAIDGASAWVSFTRITVPMISPTIFFLAITGVIQSFNVFELVAVMTQGGPGTATTMLAYYIYRSGFVFHEMGYASTMAVVMLVIVFIITIVQWYFNRKYTSFLQG